MSEFYKDDYNNMEIPDLLLQSAITKGIRKFSGQNQLHYLLRAVTVAASVVLILFFCANTPAIYTYAKNIPVLHQFMKAMHVGFGGELQEGVELSVSERAHEITFHFRSNSQQVSAAQSYEIDYYHAPVRMELTFHGMKVADMADIREKLLQTEGVVDAYEIIPPTGNDFKFSVILKKGYNYELMEFSDPGTLTINLFPDAYYEKGEWNIFRTIYYIRTREFSGWKELERQYADLQTLLPSQVKLDNGNYTLVLGEYGSREKADKAFKKILDANKNLKDRLYIDSGKAGDMMK